VAIAGVRLTSSMDVDTVWHARELAGRHPVWDPLAALVGVLARISTADAVLTTLAVGTALSAFCGMLAARLLLGTERFGAALPVALACAAVAPVVPVKVWLVLLITLAAMLQMPAHRTMASAEPAAFATAVVLVMLGTATATPVSRDYASKKDLAPRAAFFETLQITREAPGPDTAVIGDPVLGLQLERPVTFVDLASFVERFESRAGDPGFRFDGPGRRLFVFIETRPTAGAPVAWSGSFMASQPLVYQLPRERWRLAQRARALCDAYGSSHPGARVLYDDGELRIYRIDV
jgi:hypothetical protein